MRYPQDNSNAELYSDRFSSRQIDPFSDSVLKNIDSDIKNTFTKEQIDAFISALKSNQQGKKHGVDIRGLISLFFVRYYFVLLMGRDTRCFTSCLENDRRQRSQYVTGIYVGILATAIIMLIVFTILYTLKSIIGIDIFPTYHLTDFF